MGYETLLLEKRGKVAVLTLNRPANNAVSYAMLGEIDRALDEVASDGEVRVLVITGCGEKSFCAGMDVARCGEPPGRGRGGPGLWTRLTGSRSRYAAHQAAILGGGCELALACHFRYMAASDKARIGCPELNLGIIPGWGGTQRLTRLLGRSKALDLMLFSRRLNPEEALAIGLVDGVYPPDQLMPRVMEKAAELSEKAPLAVRAVLCSVQAHLDKGMDDGLKVETEQSNICAASKDAIEGFTAFLEKRKPQFRGE